MESPPPDPEIPAVSCIILNWNGWQNTLECLASVQKINYPNFRVLVVDNGSTDSSVAQIRSAFPEVALLETGKNLGYAGGNNIGIAQALGDNPDFIFLLNNDVVVDPGVLNAFVDAARHRPQGGFFGALVCNYDEPDRIEALGGGKWDEKSGCLLHFLGQKTIQQLQNDEVTTIDYALGCALFFRVGMISDVGMMEEMFFLNFEETDWCFRARAKGYFSYAVAGAKIWHKGSVSFGGEEAPLRKYFLTRNELLWARRHLSLRQRARVAKKLIVRLLPGFSLGKEGKDRVIKRLYWEISRYIREVGRRSRDPYYQAQLYGIIDYLCGRFGDCCSSIRAKLVTMADIGTS